MHLINTYIAAQQCFYEHTKNNDFLAHNLQQDMDQHHSGRSSIQGMKYDETSCLNMLNMLNIAQAVRGVLQYIAMYSAKSCLNVQAIE